MKYYTYETMKQSLRDDLRTFLHNTGIYYELSGMGEGWHFSIKCSPDDAELVNGFLSAVA